MSYMAFAFHAVIVSKVGRKAQALWQAPAAQGILKTMLQLSGSLIGQPVLSLRTGGVVATTVSPIINPNNLKIEGFYCTEAFSRKNLVLLYQDIRDVLPQGFVVNDVDVLASPDDLIRLKETMDIRFELLGKQVRTSSREKLGKVTDYATETTAMYVQKLYVGQSIFKSLSSASLSIDRTQIVEITDRHIVVQDLQQHIPAHASAVA